MECTQKGIQAGFHVIGDRAVAEVVDGFRAAAARVGAADVVRARHRLEHVEMATPEQMRVLGGLGVVASMQPMFDALWGGDDSLYAQRLGADRARPMNAFASMRPAGVALAFGSDSPVTDVRAVGGRPRGRLAPHRDRADRRARRVRRPHPGRLARRPARGRRRARRRRARHVAVWDVDTRLVSRSRRLTSGSPPGRPTSVPESRLPDLHRPPLPTCVLTLVAGNQI